MRSINFTLITLLLGVFSCSNPATAEQDAEEYTDALCEIRKMKVLVDQGKKSKGDLKRLEQEFMLLARKFAEKYGSDADGAREFETLVEEKSKACIK